MSKRVFHTTGTVAAAAEGAEPAPLPTPTITHYQQLADNFMKDLDLLSTVIPNLEASHIATVSFVRAHVNVPIPFLTTAVAAVEQTQELQAVNKFDVVAARDTLQFLEAFRPVLDKVTAFQRSLQFTMMSRRATLAADALQIYAIAKGVARDPRSAAVASLVQNLKRDLKRPGRPTGR